MPNLKQALSLANLNKTEAEILLAGVIKKPREFLYIHPETRLTTRQAKNFLNNLRRRLKGEPLAYLLGHKEFFGLDFLVNKHTLIPRPETELMVERTIPLLTENTALIDVGTGTGCISISILKSAPVRPTSVWATDISRKALRVAQKNAKLHHVNITFLRGNILKPLIRNLKSTIRPSPLIITANLPYLTREQAAGEPSIRREPMAALVAEEGGLALYRELFAQTQTFTGRAPITILCEIDPSQSEKMAVLARKFFPSAAIEIKNDLAGRDRLTIITLP